MATVEFDHRVKYRGVFYAPHAIVTVSEEDLEELDSSGAKVVSQSAQEPETASKPSVRTTAPKKPYKIPAPAKKG